MNDHVSYFVYVLSLADGSYYCSWTTDLDVRIAAHLNGKCEFVQERRPFHLVKTQQFTTKNAAIHFCAQLKKRLISSKRKLIDYNGKTLCD